MFKLSGGCHCGNLQVEIELSLPPASYAPRVCDCDFCRKHGAAYLSDSQGSFVLRAGEGAEIGIYRQGSGQAEFILCRNCGVLMGVSYRDSGRLYAAVNRQVIENGAHFGDSQTVSPQTLSPEQKTSRWKNAWFSSVIIPSSRG